MSIPLLSEEDLKLLVRNISDAQALGTSLAQAEKAADTGTAPEWLADRMAFDSAIDISVDAILKAQEGLGDGGSDAPTAQRRLQRRLNIAQAVESGYFEKLPSGSSRPDLTWRAIAERADNMLRKQTRDLDLLFVRCQALIAAYGPLALPRAIQELNGFLGKFGLDLYRSDDPDGPSAETNPEKSDPRANRLAEDLEQFASRLALLLDTSPIRLTDTSEDDGTGPLHLRDPLFLSDLDYLTGAKENASERQAIQNTAEKYGAALAEQVAVFERGLRAELEALRGTLAAPQARARKNLQNDFGVMLAERLSTAMQRVRGLMSTPDDLGTGDAEMSQAAQPSGSATGPAITSGPIQNRAQALNRLAEVAAYFEIAEPNSPLAPVLRELVRRSQLSFEEIIAEVLPEEQPRAQLLGRLGLPGTPKR